LVESRATLLRRGRRYLERASPNFKELVLNAVTRSSGES
jgi:hypothetical protein